MNIFCARERTPIKELSQKYFFKVNKIFMKAKILNFVKKTQLFKLSFHPWLQVSCYVNKFLALHTDNFSKYSAIVFSFAGK